MNLIERIKAWAIRRWPSGCYRLFGWQQRLNLEQLAKYVVLTDELVNESRREATMGKFEIFKDKQGQWRWRLRARNGKIVAVGEGYTREFSARRSCSAVQQAANGARIVE